MSTPFDTKQIDTCGCCADEAPAPSVYNPPGQDALAWRIGTWPTFLDRMKARLYRQEVTLDDGTTPRPLTALTTRASDDPTLALLDAWAVVADVLTFYQERIANEGFLRTATERQSVLELARAIGYELAPGVAAGTYLAFTVDDKTGSPGEALIAAGTQVQSLPQQQDERPQTFETTADFTAYAEWNAVPPRLTRPQQITVAADQITVYDTEGEGRVYFAGVGLNLKVGDLLLFVQSDDDGTVQANAARKLTAVTTDAEALRTVVTLEDVQVTTTPTAFTPSTTSLAAGTVFTSENADLLLAQSLSESALQATLSQLDWTADDLVAYAGSRSTGGPDGLQVYVMRERTGMFGSTAPLYASLPDDITGAFQNWDRAGGWPITLDTTVTDSETPYADADCYLDRPLSEVQAGGWVVFQQPGTARSVRQIADAFEAALAGFGLSAKGTGLTLTDNTGLDTFTVRRTVAYVKSEALTLAPLPLSGDLPEASTTLELDHLVPGLAEGQAVALTGIQAGTTDITRSEIHTIASIQHTDGYTTLELAAGLAWAYARDTVSLNANVVAATHGETVTLEALGSGDGAQTNQTFKLRKPPLTWTSAATASGRESTLAVYVDQVQWDRVDSFYGQSPDLQGYVIRLDNEANAYVLFGDGQHGARLPTGTENVQATYRSGIGVDGAVGAGTLTLLKKRPFGVKGVTNPLAASGAEDPETLDTARTNAPLTVLTLDRVVALQDYEDFARTFAGIGKAKATAVWSGEAQVVHLTIADASGNEVDPASALYTNLKAAIEAARDPLAPVEVDSFEKRLFNLTARVEIDPAYTWDVVKADLESRLQEAFAFTERAFGQAVTAAEILRLLHEAAGIVFIDLDELYQLDDNGQAVAPVHTSNPAKPLLASVLPVPLARYDAALDDILPAELLLVNPAGIVLTEH
jgi:predicted phage baseplate assembly protein